MTRKLYWKNDITEAEVDVLECKQCADGRYGLLLDATPFHPQGGGQPADIGKIGDADVFGVEIVDGEIIHYTQQRVALGLALARIDPARRRHHSRLHSAGHLIGHALESLAWQPVKAHHWPDEARVVFKPLDDAKAVDMQIVQRHCDEMIARNLPCKVQISEQQYRQVGFGDLKPYGCGGTHVTATAELQGLQILSVNSKKGQLIIQYHVKDAENSNGISA
ncbi:alanyl-tRNA editing protein [Pectobacterium punjabense]|uniref:alanyl-tRNA editing protein n=1 Tax=Pectobacterium punjabense TaxID=2108399 RepID=UPI002B24D462|nr:alanyl-tRNA editing protein [Pectobacterium punjabense]